MSWRVHTVQVDAMHEARCWALDYSTGTQKGFWGPGVLTLPGFLIAAYPTSPRAPKTFQIGQYIP